LQSESESDLIAQLRETFAREGRYITEENDDDDGEGVASISKHVACLHCWQRDLVKTKTVAVLLFCPPL